jgi:hypothetical protein
MVSPLTTNSPRGTRRDTWLIPALLYLFWPYGYRRMIRSPLWSSREKLAAGVLPFSIAGGFAGLAVFVLMHPSAYTAEHIGWVLLVFIFLVGLGPCVSGILALRAWRRGHSYEPPRVS